MKLRMLFATKGQSETTSLLSITKERLRVSDLQISLTLDSFYGLGVMKCCCRHWESWCVAFLAVVLLFRTSPVLEEFIWLFIVSFFWPWIFRTFLPPPVLSFPLMLLSNCLQFRHFVTARLVENELKWLHRREILIH